MPGRLLGLPSLPPLPQGAFCFLTLGILSRHKVLSSPVAYKPLTGFPSNVGGKGAVPTRV